MSIKKIVAFTGIRSDYDLLSGLYKRIHNEPTMEIKLIVSGSHLSSTYGNTVQEIVADQIPILSRIETLIDSNHTSGRIKSLSILLQGAIHTIQDYDPDLIVVVGDREDVITGALIGAYLNIPVAHFFGGDHASDGNVDNVVRHATSKMANIHFVTNKFSEQRLLKMGEEKHRIFNVGSPSLDKFKHTVYIPKNELLQRLGLENVENYALLIFHPILGEEEKSGEYFQQILNVLEEKGIFCFVSFPNVDSGNKLITEIIESNLDKKNFYFYKNLKRELFINLFRNTDFLIGNSSAGIYEAPLLSIPVINVGNRQKGRYSASNVLFVPQDEKEIEKAIETIKSKEFIDLLKEVSSIYGNGDSEEQIMNILKSIEFESYLYKSYDPLEVNDQ